MVRTVQRILFSQAYGEKGATELKNVLTKEGYEIEESENPLTYEQMRKCSAIAFNQPIDGPNEASAKDALKFKIKDRGAIFCNLNFSGRDAHEIFKKATSYDGVSFTRMLFDADVIYAPASPFELDIGGIKVSSEGLLGLGVFKESRTYYGEPLKIPNSWLKFFDTDIHNHVVTRDVKKLHEEEREYNLVGISPAPEISGCILSRSAFENKPLFSEFIPGTDIDTHSRIFGSLIDELAKYNYVGVAKEGDGRGRALLICRKYFEDRFIQMDKERVANARLAQQIFEWLCEFRPIKVDERIEAVTPTATPVTVSVKPTKSVLGYETRDDFFRKIMRECGIADMGLGISVEKMRLLAERIGKELHSVGSPLAGLYITDEELRKSEEARESLYGLLLRVDGERLITEDNPAMIEICKKAKQVFGRTIFDLDERSK